MPLVVGLRHADYSHDGERGISETGKIQAQKAAEKLKSMITDSPNVLLLSSPVKRAIDTAQIIGAETGLAPEPCEHLAEYPKDGFQPVNLWKEILAGKIEADVIILVTHFYTVEDGPKEFAALLSTNWQKCREPRKAQGWIINTNPDNVSYEPFTL